MKLLISSLMIVSLYIMGGLCDTDCPEERKKALESNSEGNIVPKCTENGEFQDLQCVDGTANCTCYRPDGTQIMEPNTNVRSCRCISHKDKVARMSSSGKKLIGVYLPQCVEDGSYNRTQCHGSTASCWCVNEKGKKTDKSLGKC